MQFVKDHLYQIFGILVGMGLTFTVIFQFVEHVDSFVKSLSVYNQTLTITNLAGWIVVVIFSLALVVLALIVMIYKKHKKDSDSLKLIVKGLNSKISSVEEDFVLFSIHYEKLKILCDDPSERAKHGFDEDRYNAGKIAIQKIIGQSGAFVYMDHQKLLKKLLDVKIPELKDFIFENEFTLPEHIKSNSDDYIGVIEESFNNKNIMEFEYKLYDLIENKKVDREGQFLNVKTLIKKYMK